MQIDKQRLLDSSGKPMTQSLFLEVGYNEDLAVYSLKDYHYKYKGKDFPSLKLLYLQHEDVLEYDFATTYFLSWDHWLRICRNKLFSKHVDSWRIELELKLASRAVRSILDMSEEEKGFQAAKYIAERQWNKNPVGRPKKDTSEADRAVEERLNNEFAEDVKRLQLRS